MMHSLDVSTVFRSNHGASCWASSQEHLEFKLAGVYILEGGSDPPNPLNRHCLDNRYVNKRLYKILEDGKHDIHHNS